MSRNNASLVILVLVLAGFLIFEPDFVCSSDINENTWVPKADMPISGQVESAAAIGKIYVMTWTSNYEYDPSTNIWTQKLVLPISHDSLSSELSFSMASCNNKIYVIGGGGTNKESLAPFYLSTNEVYDPLNNTWQTLAPMPTARTRVELASVNGKIYAIGGINDDEGKFSSINITEIYDPLTNSWSTGLQAPLATSWAPCAVVDNKIYIVGGTTNMIYDTQTDTWGMGTQPPTRFGHLFASATTGVFAPKRIYVLTDELTTSSKISDGNYEFTSTLNIFDPQLDSWSSMTVPISRSLSAMAVVKDTLYVIGGASSWHPKQGWPGFSEVQMTSAVDQYIPLGYGTIEPVISFISPITMMYNESSIPLTFAVDKSVSWVTYSLDGQANVSISGNATLGNLSNGIHNITIYAKYSEGAVGTSEPVSFTVAKQADSYPIVAIAGISVGLVAAGIGAIYYRRKRFL